jgi:putative iron-dependent peroxidase
VFDRETAIRATLADAFLLDDAIDLFRYRTVRRPDGYEDGTENPEGRGRDRRPPSSTGGKAVAGSSFVACSAGCTTSRASGA